MAAMRVLIFGGRGMLGSDLGPELVRRGCIVSSPSSGEANVVDPTQVAEWLGKGWDWVVNLAAYTQVDKAEIETDCAIAVNALGAGYVARACAIHGTPLLHVGSDFVFDGALRRPYTEADPTNPLGAYARTKRQGEEAVLLSGARAMLVRTAWLFGPHGSSFPRTILRAARAGKPLRVVDDQTGSPTYTTDLSRVLADLIDLGPEPGVYHAAGPEPMTWHELAVRTLRAAGIDAPVEPIGTEDWPTPATRPAYSVLSFEKCAGLGIAPMRPIDEALREFIVRLEPEDQTPAAGIRQEHR